MSIKSIWQNRFYTDYKPLPKWCFKVKFGRTDLGTAPTLLVRNISWGERDSQIAETYYLGIRNFVNARINNGGDLKIEFNETDSLSISNKLEMLFNLSWNQDYFENNGAYGNPITMDITVYLCKYEYNMTFENKDNNIAKTIIFHNCQLYHLDAVDMDYNSEEDVVTRSATFKYVWMEYGSSSAETKDDVGGAKQDSGGADESSSSGATNASESSATDSPIEYFYKDNAGGEHKLELRDGKFFNVERNRNANNTGTKLFTRQGDNVSYFGTIQQFYDQNG